MVLDNPIDLPLPDVDRGLSKSNEEGGILGQGIRKLNKMTHHKGPEGHGPAGHGLIGVGIEKGRIIFNIEKLHPFGITVGQGRPESNCLPLLQVMVDTGCPFFEDLF